MFQTLMMVCASTSSLMLGTDSFTLRPYASVQDKDKLDEISKDAWKGQDFLPGIAPALEEDPTCDFAVLEDEKTGEMVATGNRRTLDPEGRYVWIEAIRVSSKYQGRGVGTMLLRELCRRSRDSGAKEIISCTLDSNIAMKKVFAKEEVGMTQMMSMHFPDIAKLKELPGWSATATDSEQVETQNILKANKIEHLVSDEARSQHWETVESEEELKSLLSDLKTHGMSGHMPGFGKIMWISDDVRDSLKKGLIRKLCKTDGEAYAIFALVKEKAIKSFRSKYLCSIVARTSIDFDSAVWEACKSENVHLLGGNPAFFVMSDDSIPYSPGSLMDSIPRGPLVAFYRWEENN